jgi:predicted metal-dependent phosphoesterase TrpH
MEIRGILHCHSTYSYDAKLSLRELRELFIVNGLHFVCMTEHTDELTRERAAAFVAECDALSDETFRFIPGFEVPYGKGTHILMIGMREFLGSYAPDINALRVWTRHTPFVVLAHPVRNRFSVDDGLLSVLHGLEVWNQQYEGKRVPRTRSLRLFDILRAKKQSLVATGGVDFHRSEHFGGPFVTLNVDSLIEREILERLKSGVYTISSDRARFFGLLQNTDELIRAHRMESLLSVIVITLGKYVNKMLIALGLSFPRRLKELVRRRL